MGLRFRKSVKMGPVRINLSKSGVGWSVGSKGARLTKKANGGYRTTVGVPGTGVSYVQDYSGTPQQPQTPASRDPRREPRGSKRKSKRIKHPVLIAVLAIFCFAGLAGLLGCNEQEQPEKDLVSNGETTPVVEDVVETAQPQEPVEEPTPQEPVEEPQPQEPVEEPQPQEPVEEPQPQEPVEEPQPQEPVEEPQPQEPVEEPQAQEVAEEAAVRYVYITETGKKYHEATCRYAKNATKVTLEEAVALGLEPCGVCH